MDVQISQLPYRTFRQRCRNGQLQVDLGLVNINMHSAIERVINNLWRLYGEYPYAATDSYIDYHLSITPVNSFRRWLKPQINFQLDHQRPFKPLGRSQAFAMFEWGLNWSVVAHDNTALYIHGAVVERNNKAIILPAPPGSGKSTLCAALIQEGWRLLSDEMAIISLSDDEVRPFVRPVSLKNESIGLIQARYPEAVFSDIAHDTHKGDVAHLKAPTQSIARMNQPAEIFAFIQPAYQPSPGELALSSFSQSEAFMLLAENSFNYSVLADDGFERMGELVSRFPCRRIAYHRLDEAIAYLNEITHE